MKNRLMYHRLLKVTILLVCLFKMTSSDVIRLGRCPMVKLQRGFRNFLFSGDWYEVAKNPMIFLTNSKCNKVNFRPTGGSYSIKSSATLKSMNKQITFEANAFTADNENPSKLTIQYPLTLFKTNITLPYWVLYTDYETAVVWSCIEYLKLFHLEYFWILARKPYLGEDKLRDLMDILTLNDIDSTYIIQTDQVGCM